MFFLGSLGLAAIVLCTYKKSYFIDQFSLGGRDSNSQPLALDRTLNRLAVSSALTF